ncbi:helix-turn-helix domain-containing protein [Isachenkonia alkalipeptolytica]|uniref:Helix-turn-helix transcriptional regulator n=1 Tax=Isachenkonia alkalipeptolytica TaxID=2565777 RepID=A0AA43XJS5_9CLOT|nr:helix-turn-helix transcriptional regulator [Isachenkonia alkalipeptolytica]NBG88113.1 helix-turn-helix transcriptional regulator [Isachenkonia alkalipeptolytica]
MKQLAANLPTLRKTLGFTQSELAEQIGTTRQSIAVYESGKRIPGWTVTVALLTVFIFSQKTLVLLFPLDILSNDIFDAIPTLNNYVEKNIQNRNL